MGFNLSKTVASGLMIGALAACGGSQEPAASPEAAAAEAPADPADPAAGHAEHAEHGTEPTEAAGDKACCKGMNECKGKGACKTDANACAGMNECKGKGGCNGHCPK